MRALVHAGDLDNTIDGRDPEMTLIAVGDGSDDGFTICEARRYALAIIELCDKAENEDS